MELLQERNNEKYWLYKEFDYEFLTPVAAYVFWKIQNKRWDDYNEMYHAAKLVEFLKDDQRLWFDTHVLYCNDNPAGVMLIVGGELKRFEKRFNIENEDQSLLLKYFHIIEKGRGYGSYWIKNVITPYYRQKGFKSIYISSSHKDSFPFYERFSHLISTYEQNSDNDIHKREGRCFLLSI